MTRSTTDMVVMRGRTQHGAAWCVNPPERAQGIKDTTPGKPEGITQS